MTKILYIISKTDPLPGNSFQHKVNQGDSLWECLVTPDQEDRLRDTKIFVGTEKELRESKFWGNCRRIHISRTLSYRGREIPAEQWIAPDQVQSTDEILGEELAPHGWLGIS